MGGAPAGSPPRASLAQAAPAPLPAAATLILSPASRASTTQGETQICSEPLGCVHPPRLLCPAEWRRTWVSCVSASSMQVATTRQSVRSCPLLLLTRPLTGSLPLLLSYWSPLSCSSLILLLSKSLQSRIILYSNKRFKRAGTCL